jgi:uncharacterized protein YndB with AHSA1/START domain
MTEPKVSKAKYVYVTYIASTREKVVAALTSAEMSAQYWSGFSVTSDWNVGSAFSLRRKGKVWDTGTVLEHDPPYRLSYTFHPEHSGVEHEKASRVTFTLEDVNGRVKLTMLHDDFEWDSKVFEMVQTGWPSVLSSLKSLIETGKPLPPAMDIKD